MDYEVEYEGERVILSAEDGLRLSLTLSGQPKKAIPAGTKIGTVTVTIGKVVSTGGGGSVVGPGGTLPVEPAPASFSFSVNNVEYQAEGGMTWAEWLDSEYNTSAENGTALYLSWDEEYTEKAFVYYESDGTDGWNIVTIDGTYAGRVFSTDTINAAAYTSYFKSMSMGM